MNPVVQSTMKLIGATQDMPTSTAISQYGLNSIVNGLITQEGNTLQTDSNGNIYRVNSQGQKIINNPGNVVYTGQTGASSSGVSFVGSDGKTYYYANFDNSKDGQQAVSDLVQNAASKGENLSDFITSYKGVSNSANSTATPGSIASGITNSSVLPAIGKTIAALFGGSSASSSPSTTPTSSSTSTSGQISSTGVAPLSKATIDDSTPTSAIQRIVQEAGGPQAVTPENEVVDSPDIISEPFTQAIQSMVQKAPPDQKKGLNDVFSKLISSWDDLGDKNKEIPKGTLPTLAQGSK